MFIVTILDAEIILIKCMSSYIPDIQPQSSQCKNVWRYQRGKQNMYIVEGHTM